MLAIYIHILFIYFLVFFFTSAFYQLPFGVTDHVFSVWSVGFSGRSKDRFALLHTNIRHPFGLAVPVSDTAPTWAHIQHTFLLERMCSKDFKDTTLPSGPPELCLRCLFSINISISVQLYIYIYILSFFFGWHFGWVKAPVLPAEVFSHKTIQWSWGKNHGLSWKNLNALWCFHIVDTDLFFFSLQPVQKSAHPLGPMIPVFGIVKLIWNAKPVLCYTV